MNHEEMCPTNTSSQSSNFKGEKVHGGVGLSDYLDKPIFWQELTASLLLPLFPEAHDNEDHQQQKHEAQHAAQNNRVVHVDRLAATCCFWSLVCWLLWWNRWWW